MGGDGNFPNLSKLGGANKLKKTKKVENSVIDPPPYNQRGKSGLKIANKTFKISITHTFIFSFL